MRNVAQQTFLLFLLLEKYTRGISDVKAGAPSHPSQREQFETDDFKNTLSKFWHHFTRNYLFRVLHTSVKNPQESALEYNKEMLHLTEEFKNLSCKAEVFFPFRLKYRDKR